LADLLHEPHERAFDPPPAVLLPEQVADPLLQLGEGHGHRRGFPAGSGAHPDCSTDLNPRPIPPGAESNRAATEGGPYQSCLRRGRPPWRPGESPSACFRLPRRTVKLGPMPTRRKFLTARWCNLILANYAVPEELLRPRLPPGIDLDTRDGRCWASLVGFQFLDTRVLGVGWPGYRNFPEWNLRFYVTHQGRRGVCFVREFVPRWLVATMARVIYNEPYRAARMTMDVTDEPDSITADYTVSWG